MKQIEYLKFNDWVLVSGDFIGKLALSSYSDISSEIEAQITQKGYLSSYDYSDISSGIGLSGYILCSEVSGKLALSTLDGISVYFKSASESYLSSTTEFVTINGFSVKGNGSMTFLSTYSDISSNVENDITSKDYISHSEVSGKLALSSYSDISSEIEYQITAKGYFSEYSQISNDVESQITSKNYISKENVEKTLALSTLEGISGNFKSASESYLSSTTEFVTINGFSVKGNGSMTLLSDHQKLRKINGIDLSSDGEDLTFLSTYGYSDISSGIGLSNYMLSCDLSDYFSKSESDDRFVRLSPDSEQTVSKGITFNGNVQATGVLSSSCGLNVGNDNKLYGDCTVAEGSDTVAYGNFSHSEGKSSKALGMASHAEGYNNFAIGDYSHAEGDGYCVAGTRAFQIVSSNIELSILTLDAISCEEGSLTSDVFRDKWVTVFQRAKTDGNISATFLTKFCGVVEGTTQVSVTYVPKFLDTYVNASLYFVDYPLYGTITVGSGAHVHGYQSHAMEDSTAFGCNNYALGRYSFALGNANKTDYMGVAIGSGNGAYGQHSIAMGGTGNATSDTLGTNTQVYAAKAFGWSGNGQYEVPSDRTGTFNINPKNGIKGIYIGSNTLYDHLLSSFYLKSETSSSSQISDALSAKADTSSLSDYATQNQVDDKIKQLSSGLSTFTLNGHYDDDTGGEFSFKVVYVI